MIEALPTPRIDRAVRRLDALRRNPGALATATAVHKEWLHFSIRLPCGHVLFNLSAMERPETLEGGQTIWRAAILLELDGHWTGDVVEVPSQNVRHRPPLTLEVGPARMDWLGHAYRISGRIAGIDLQADVHPCVLPTTPSSVSFAEHHAMHWVVVPRALARGRLIVEGRRIEFADAASYHDHNWGHFAWGSDLVWEWGHLLPESRTNPWTLVFVRVSDARRLRTSSQGLLIWKGQRNERTFTNSEIRIDQCGVFESARPKTVPHTCGLLVAGSASGIPARFQMRAAAYGCEIELEYWPVSASRVAIPADRRPLGMTLLNETAGRARVRGRIRGDALDYETPAIVEFVRDQHG